MKPYEFNIIEFSQNYEKGKDQLVVSYRKKTYRFFGDNYLEKFLNLIKDRKNIVFYMTDPTKILPTLLNFSEKEKNFTIKSIFFAKTSLYSIEIQLENNNIKIKNIIHLLGDDFDEILEGCWYTSLSYWSELKSHPIREVYSEMRSKFFGDLEESNKENQENNLIIDNLLLLSSNTSYLKTLLELANSNYSLLDPYWMHRLSLGSIALNIFNSNYNTNAIEIINKTHMDEAIRSGFFGGRCEVLGNYYKNEEKILHFDFPNMYGELLMSNFPTGDLIYIENIDKIDRPGFYYCEVESVGFSLPILPHKAYLASDSDPEDILRNEMLFTNGKFEGLYFSEELEFFLKNKGKLIKIKYAYVFNKTSEPIFYQFAKNIIKFRSNNNKKLWKKVLVAFFGRLGMKPIRSETTIVSKKDYTTYIKNKTIIQEKWIRDYCIIETETKPSEVKSLVHYAAIVTSRARIKLYRNLTAVQKSGGRLLYCDTDSIFAAYKDISNIMDKRIEDVIWDSTKSKTFVEKAVFASSRTYSIVSKEDIYETKILGIPRNSVDYDKFETMFYSPNDKEMVVSRKQKIDSWKTSENEFLINLKSYKKRKFSKDRKKTTPYTKINNSYI